MSMRLRRIAVTALIVFLAVVLPVYSQVRFDSFSLRDFDYVVDFALDRYIDPNTIDLSRAYVGATEAALSSLPRPLRIYPRSFFDNRAEIQAPDQIVPGKAVSLSPSYPYVLLEPDEEQWQAMTTESRRRTAEMRQSMTDEELRRELDNMRNQRELEKQALESAWQRTPFSRADFLKIVGWIERNQQAYFLADRSSRDGDSPQSAASPAEEPYGMRDFYFNAANGFVSTFDPHTDLQRVETWDKIRSDSQDSSYEGIGALLGGGGPNDVVVETPLANSPALKSGLRAGDIIRKVDGASIDGLSLSEVVNKILGPRGTVVELEIERPPVMETMTIRIVRGLIEQKAVSHEYLEDEKVGVIRISSFLYEEEGNETSTMVMQAYFDLMNESLYQMDALVLDFRDNRGGFWEEAIAVAGLFLDSDAVVVQRTSASRGMKSYKNPFYPIDDRIPLAVLINAASASASEIVASALMDYNRALIMGERSFGKATVQEVHTLGDVVLKLTTGRYYSPRGYTLQISGVTPDIPVSDEADGGFPEVYREEDMWHSFPKLEQRREDPTRRQWVEAIMETAGDDGEAYLERHKNDAVKPDYMLFRSLGYVSALKRYPTPSYVLPEPQPLALPETID